MDDFTEIEHVQDLLGAAGWSRPRILTRTSSRIGGELVQRLDLRAVNRDGEESELTVFGTRGSTQRWIHPDDPYLPSLRRFVRAEEVPKSVEERIGPVTSVTVLTYMPTQRAVVRLDGDQSVVARVLRSERLSAAVERHRRARAVLDMVPDLRLVDESEGLMIVELIDGITLRDRLFALAAAPGGEFANGSLAIDDLIRTVEAIHSVPVAEARRLEDRSGEQDGDARSSPDMQRQRLNSACRRLSRDHPEMGALLHSINAEAASSDRSECLTTVHGDLHAGQLILDESDRVRGLIDLDAFGVGDPIVEIGHLLASCAAYSWVHPPESPMFELLLSGLSDGLGRDEIVRSWITELVILAARASDAVGGNTTPGLEPWEPGRLLRIAQDLRP